MSRLLPIDLPYSQLMEFCQRHYICKLSLFGSILRDDFKSESDIDMLVEFDPAHTPGLIRLVGMEIELAELMHRKVDLRTPEDLSQYFRQRVLDTAELI